MTEIVFKLDGQMTTYVTRSHPEMGDTAVTIDPDGTTWLCARDYMANYAKNVLEGTGIALGPPRESTVEKLLCDVTSRWKASKRFHTSDGFMDLLGLTAEGLKYFNDYEDPGLMLVKPDSERS